MVHMLVKRKIKESQVHFNARNNAVNMNKAMRNRSLNCFAHMLQLIVQDSVLFQRIVIDTLASAHHIVNSFKYYPLAYGQLKEIQENLQLPVRTCTSYELTRWNSIFYM